MSSIVALSTVASPVGRKNELNTVVVVNGFVPAPPAAVQSGSFVSSHKVTPTPPCQKPGVQPSPGVEVVMLPATCSPVDGTGVPNWSVPWPSAVQEYVVPGLVAVKVQVKSVEAPAARVVAPPVKLAQLPP